VNRQVLEKGRPEAGSVWEAGSWYRRSDGDTRGVLVLDADGSGVPEILTGNEAGYLVCYEHTGKPLWKRLIGGAVNALLAADVNGDGTDEVVVAGDGPGLRVFDRVWREIGSWSALAGGPVLKLWAVGNAVAVQTADGAVMLVEFRGA
jgi:hypothetical protein